MNLLLNASIVAGSLFLFNVAEPAKAAVIDPIAPTAPDSNLLLAHGGHGGGHWGGHGGHWGGGHGGWYGHHGWGGGGWGWGGAAVGVYPYGYSGDSGYYSTHCAYDYYGVRHCHRVFHYY